MKQTVRNYLGIILGALITAAALNMFLIPNKIAAGGVSGLATVLHHLFGLPVGMTMLAIDIPLFLVSVKLMGPRFGVNTLVGAAILSVSIDGTAPFLPVITHDLLLCAVYGGVMAGIGLGLVFRFKGTTAGTDMVAAVVNKLFGIRVGQALLLIDFFVIVIAGVAFKSAELSLYALISLYVTTQIIDLVQEGPTTAKLFMIMTQQPQVVSDAILKDMDRGVTLLAARGGYTNEQRDMLMCVVSTSEVTRLKELIQELDPKAFVVLADAHEVLGEGFN